MVIGYAGAFLGGVAAILSPCAALLLPAFFAYAFGHDRARLLGRTGLFYLGLLITLVPLGLGAGALGSLVSTHRGTLAVAGGVVLIGFGLLQALGVPLALPGIRRRGDPKGPLGAILLGMTYGLAGACTGPLLGAVLTVAAMGASPAYGAVLLACFAAGMVVPLVLLAWLWDRLRLSERPRPRQLHLGPFTTSWVSLASGGLFVVIGVLFLATDATAALGGILDATTQYRLESWLRGIGDTVPDLAFLGALILVVGIVGWALSLRRPTADEPESEQPPSTREPRPHP